MFKWLLSKWVKKNGVSVLISAQNEERTIRECVVSFMALADEIIIVTNGSTDRTIEICEQLQREYSGVVYFYNKPDLPDLYHNRSFAHGKARYRWVVRCDGDYVAYNDEDGRYSIRLLRNRILQEVTIFPTAFMLEQVNVSYKLNLTRSYFSDCSIPNKMPFTYGEGFMPRVYLNTPLLKFARIGNGEGVFMQNFYKKVFLDRPYWFHITLNDDDDIFLRSARREWRGSAQKDRPLLDYIKEVHLPLFYPGKTLHEARDIYISEVVLPSLKEYEEELYFPYPKSISRMIDE